MGLFASKQAVWDYEIECLDMTEYKMAITFHADTKLFKTLLQKSIVKLKRQKGIDVDGKIDDMNGISLPPEYIPMIQNFIKKPMHILKTKHIEPDGIDIISFAVRSCTYKKASETEWDIIVIVHGLYNDKRIIKEDDGQET